MSIKDFIFCLQCGEELEISVSKKKYFLQPDYKTLNKNRNVEESAYSQYIIYYVLDDLEDCQELFKGTIEEVIDFRFDNMYTFRDDFVKFNIIG